jgi:hypothetical protein
VINLKPQHLIPREGPLISIAWEALWAPEPVWAYEDINPKQLPGTEQFHSHLIIIKCAIPATEIMVAF